MLKPAGAPLFATKDELRKLQGKCGGAVGSTGQPHRKFTQGNMTELRAVKFRCDNRTCGATQVRLYIPPSEDEATMWLAGGSLPAEREARDDRDPREN